MSLFQRWGWGKGLTEAENAVWQQQWELHVMAHLYAARAVLPGMLKRVVVTHEHRLSRWIARSAVPGPVTDPRPQR